MAFTKDQMAAITRMMEAYIAAVRPAEEIRHQLDLGWRLDRQSVYIFTIRPDWQDPSIIRHHDFAKATWVKSKGHWEIFWQRANGNWTTYQALPSVGNLQLFLEEVERNPHFCFDA